MTNTNDPLKNFIVNCNIPVEEPAIVIVQPPTALQRLKRHIRLQTEMALFDLWYGTDYRRIRNDLVREQKKRAFEARICIARIPVKTTAR